MRLSTSCCLLLVSLGLALAIPAHKKIEKKSISNSLAPKAIQPVEQKLDEPKINDEALMESAGENVDRAKKQASTTFCVEIRQNKQVQVDCDDANRPSLQPAAPSAPAQESQEPQPQQPAQPSVQIVPGHQPQEVTFQIPVPCEPEMGAFVVPPSGEVILAPTGNCANHIPSLLHLPSIGGGMPLNPAFYTTPTGSSPYLHIPTAVGPSMPTISILPGGVPAGPAGVPTHTPGGISPSVLVHPPSGHPSHTHPGHGLHPHGPGHVHLSGVECTCKSTGLSRLAEGPGGAGGSDGAPSNEALAMQFLQNLQRNAQQPANVASSPSVTLTSNNPAKASQPSGSAPSGGSSIPTLIVSNMPGSSTPSASQPAAQSPGSMPITVSVSPNSKSDDSTGGPRASSQSESSPGKQWSWTVGMPSQSSGQHPAGAHPWSWTVGMPSPSSQGSHPVGAHPWSWSVGMPSPSSQGGHPAGAHPWSWTVGMPSPSSQGGHPAGAHPWSWTVGMPSPSSQGGHPAGAHPWSWTVGMPSPSSQGGQPAGAHPWSWTVGMPASGQHPSGGSPSSSTVGMPSPTSHPAGSQPWSWTVGMPASGQHPSGGSPSSWTVGMPSPMGGQPAGSPASWSIHAPSGSPLAKSALPMSARYMPMVRPMQSNVQQQVVYQQQSAVNGLNGLSGMPMGVYPGQTMYPGGVMGPMMRSKADCLEDSFQTLPMAQGLRLSRGEENSKDKTTENKEEGPVEEKKFNQEQLKQSAGQKDEKDRIARFLKEQDIESNKLEEK